MALKDEGLQNLTIDSAELRQIWETNDNPKSVRIIDVREPVEWANARIEGSELMPLSEWPNKALKDLPVDKNQNENLVIVCAHGVRSMNATLFLKSQGFQNVRSLRGGLASYLGIP